ncbi:MAG: thioredoxin family protein [Rhodomicrobium sp.]
MFVLRAKIPPALTALACALLLFAATAASPARAAELVVFGSARCPYCLAWEREIGHAYPKSEEAQQAPLRRVAIQAQRPSDLARIKDVHVTPTFVLVDNGREVGRIVGYSGNEFFWPELHRLLARLHPKG